MSYQQQQQQQSPYTQQSPPGYPQPSHSNQHQEKQFNNIQPQGAPMMQVAAGGNRNAKNMPMDAEGREWSHGLCSCADGGTCFLAWCCPCIAYTKVKHRYDHLAEKGYPDPEHGGDCCTGDCMMHCLLTSFCGVGWVFQMSNRSSMRKRYNIKGGGCGDCMTAFCCTPCELSQESAELELEEQSFHQQVHH